MCDTSNPAAADTPDDSQQFMVGPPGSATTSEDGEDGALRQQMGQGDDADHCSPGSGSLSGQEQQQAFISPGRVPLCGPVHPMDLASAQLLMGCCATVFPHPLLLCTAVLGIEDTDFAEFLQNVSEADCSAVDLLAAYLSNLRTMQEDALDASEEEDALIGADTSVAATGAVSAHSGPAVSPALIPARYAATLESIAAKARELIGELALARVTVKPKKAPRSSKAVQQRKAAAAAAAANNVVGENGDDDGADTGDVSCDPDDAAGAMFDSVVATAGSTSTSRRGSASQLMQQPADGNDVCGSGSDASSSHGPSSLASSTNGTLASATAAAGSSAAVASTFEEEEHKMLLAWASQDGGMSGVVPAVANTAARSGATPPPAAATPSPHKGPGHRGPANASPRADRVSKDAGNTSSAVHPPQPQAPRNPPGGQRGAKRAPVIAATAAIVSALANSDSPRTAGNGDGSIGLNTTLAPKLLASRNSASATGVNQLNPHMLGVGGGGNGSIGSVNGHSGSLGLMGGDRAARQAAGGGGRLSTDRAPLELGRGAGAKRGAGASSTANGMLRASSAQPGLGGLLHHVPSAPNLLPAAAAADSQAATQHLLQQAGLLASPSLFLSQATASSGRQGLNNAQMHALAVATVQQQAQQAQQQLQQAQFQLVAAQLAGAGSAQQLAAALTATQQHGQQQPGSSASALASMYALNAAGLGSAGLGANGSASTGAFHDALGGHMGGLNGLNSVYRQHSADIGALMAVSGLSTGNGGGGGANTWFGPAGTGGPGSVGGLNHSGHHGGAAAGGAVGGSRGRGTAPGAAWGAGLEAAAVAISSSPFTEEERMRAFLMQMPMTHHME